ncbi:MAG: (2Fe-2S) ferredoxin domain-containing protein [Candidatus Hydrogenedentales bacterium]
MYVPESDEDDPFDDFDDADAGTDDSGMAVLYVCAGGGCEYKNSHKIRARLKELVKERGLEDRIRVRKSECMGMCGRGPIVKLTLGNLIFMRVKPKKAEAILDAAEQALCARLVSGE